MPSLDKWMERSVAFLSASSDIVVIVRTRFGDHFRSMLKSALNWPLRTGIGEIASAPRERGTVYMAKLVMIV